MSAGTTKTGTAHSKPLVVRIQPGVEPDPSLLGGKAASLATLAAFGARVPPAFVLTTAAYRVGLDDRVWAETVRAVEWLEKLTSKRFGEDLLVSVRSGAPVSMPGMMDTVLNIGLTDRTRGNAAFLERCAQALRRSIEDNCDAAGVPDDPYRQLRLAIEAVFKSWDSERASLYRRIRGIDNALGTSATVQAMVFGNRDANSGTGVLLTRNTTTGAREPVGEYCPMAQGEELVSGIRTPEPLQVLADVMPEAWHQLLEWGAGIEQREGDVQDIEFTVEQGELYLLQSRAAKRTSVAACQVAVDLAEEGIISIAEAVERTISIDLDMVKIPQVDYAGPVLGIGKGTVLKVADGPVVTSSREAVRVHESGVRPILVRDTTSPNDLAGMRVASGVVTRKGGQTSHAALVARELDVACVVGCADLPVLEDGQVITVDGSAGLVYPGRQSATESAPRAVEVLRTWRRETIRRGTD